MTTWVVDNGGGTIVVSTLDDIPDGSTYVKSENNLTDALLTKINGVDTGATDDQTGDEMVTAVNASAGGLNLDKAIAGTTNKLLTANEKTGAGYGYSHLDTNGLVAGSKIGSTLASVIETKANDSLQKSSDDLDDISDGTTYGKVKNDNLSSGNVNKLHDGASLRGIGTAENEIPLLGVGGRLPASRLEAEAVILNGGGTLERASGSAINLDNVDDGSLVRSVPVAETKRIVLWQSDTLNRAAGAITYSPFLETSASWIRKIAIPYLHSADVQTIELKTYLRNTVGGSDGEAQINVFSVNPSNGEAQTFATIAGATLSVTGSTWDTVDEDLDVTGLTAGVHYLIVIAMQASGDQAEMDHVMIAKNVLVVE
ncbi:MAG: hypothetical protein H8D23_22045 [Candidatus Brocadiales bacterium]|nr:hypothetical protein [Candidatus Brocadiales bacterium]